MALTPSPTHSETSARPERVSDPKQLRRLGELITLLVDGAPFHWSTTIQFGAAGTVTIAYDLNPQELDDGTRADLLSIAARLTNWHHTD